MKTSTPTESPPDDPVDPKHLEVDERRRRIRQEPQTITMLREFLRDGGIGGTPVCLLCGRYDDFYEAKQHELEEHIASEYSYRKLDDIPRDHLDAHWILIAEISRFTHPRIIKAHKRRILRTLRDADGSLKTKEVASAVGISEIDSEQVADYLSELYDEGEIVETEDGWRPASGGG